MKNPFKLIEFKTAQAMCLRLSNEQRLEIENEEKRYMLSLIKTIKNDCEMIKDEVPTDLSKEPEIPLQNEDKDETELISDFDNEFAEAIREIKKGKPENVLKRVCYILSQFYNGNYSFVMEERLKPFELTLIDSFFKKMLGKMKKKFGKSKNKKIRALLSKTHDLIINGDIDAIKKSVFNSPIMFFRRNEEKLKFVMKNTVKYLRVTYFKRNGLNACPDSELQFLNHYFGNHPRLKDLPIEAFGDPLNSSTIVNPKFVTLSGEYFALVFASELFKNDFLYYMMTDLKSNYQMSVFKKFEKIFQKLTMTFQKTHYSHFSKAIKDYISYFKVQRGVKIPWADNEIDDAVKAFKKHLHKYCTEIEGLDEKSLPLEDNQLK